MRAVVYVLFFLAAIPRLADLGGKSFWVDEAHGVCRNLGPLRDITARCMRAHEAPLREYVLHFAVLARSDARSGPLPGRGAEAASRLLPAIAGSLTVPLVFLIGRLLFGQTPGLLAALLLLVHPWHVLHSQDARMHAVVLFFAAVLLYMICRLLYEKHSLKGWATVGIVAALAAYFSYIVALPFIALAGLVATECVLRLSDPDRRADGRRLAAGALIAAAVFAALYAPWAGVALRVVARYSDQPLLDDLVSVATPTSSPASSETGPAPPPDTPPPPVPPQAVPPQPSSAQPPLPNPNATEFTLRYAWDMMREMGGGRALVSLLFLALAVIGFPAALDYHGSKAWVAVWWFAAPLPVLFFTHAGEFFPSRYMLYFLAVYVVLAGLGADTVCRTLPRLFGPQGGVSKRGNAARIVVCVLVLGAILSAHAIELTRYYSSEKQNWRAAVGFVEEHAQDDDRVIAGDNWASYGIYYYLNMRAGKRLSLAPSALTLGDFEFALLSKTNVWYVYWRDLPDYIREIVDAEMDEMRVFPGLLGNVHVMRRKAYQGADDIP
ncbi:glycosyltransferase family 39 protein [Candidatus Sumerlaeota bacterium]|nr:glycosyltransferase family 39 protein [Candidatus Sumerlaeota bacterium]